MDALHLGILTFFAISMSAEDLRIHKIRNRKLLYFLCSLMLFSFLPSRSQLNPIASFEFFAIFTSLYILSNRIHRSGGIGFGDVKLISLLAFGYFDAGFRSMQIYFISLWIAVMAHMCLYLLMYRKYPHRIAMAPDIFFASGLYMYAPIGLLLPQ